MPFTPSESLVAFLCQRSFLSLWSEANPLSQIGQAGKKEKELCDLLVVCAPDVVILSVKDIALKDTGKPEVDWQRWHRKAVDESVKQIYGAERWIRTASRAIRSDGSPGLSVPSTDEIRVHRVAIAVGGRGEVPYQQGDFGKGFVHVLDEQALRTVLLELDTITDFVEYLTAKEALLQTGSVVMQGREEDLLALYLHRGRVFPKVPDLMIIADGLWAELTQKPEWRARKEADSESYIWDGLIQTLHNLHETEEASAEDSLDSLERALRAMARETRFSRRVLAQAFNEFMRDAAQNRTRARLVQSPADVRYVFLGSKRDEEREGRRHELTLRCFVARGRPDLLGTTVVGIATEQYKKNAGFSLDACCLTMPEWTEKQQEAMEGIQRDLGYFASPVITRTRVDEFPGTS